MEEQLIREGMPVEEIQRLCDLHVAVVRDSLEKQEEIEAPPGHPVHTYRGGKRDHHIDVANRLGATLRGRAKGVGCRPRVVGSSSPRSWRRSLGIDNHYLRKENELFPVLERHGVTGPSQVMWGVHDEIRAQVKAAKALLAAGSVDGSGQSAGTSLARAAVEMVYKENKILFPLAQQTLSHQEWAEVRKGEDELGYAFQGTRSPFPAASSGAPSRDRPLRADRPQGRPREPQAEASVCPSYRPHPRPPSRRRPKASTWISGTGRLSIEQVDMMLRHLPIEISFVDADGFVRYYSDTEERLFPRTPGAIGRHVKNCHPPKSVHMVEEILRKFAGGERDVAEFWIQMQEKFIHIRYFAVRNASKEYLGCLEVTQDVTGIRALEGQQRLLEWS